MQTFNEAVNTLQVTKMFNLMDGHTSAHTFAAIKPLKKQMKPNVKCNHTSTYDIFQPKMTLASGAKRIFEEHMYLNKE